MTNLILNEHSKEHVDDKNIVTSTSNETTSKPVELTTHVNPTKNEEAIEVTKPVETTRVEPQVVSLGEFKLTAYCSCVKCCGVWATNRPKDENGNEIIYGASGERLTAGISVAVDPNVIKYGTKIIINGHTYIAHDSGYGVDGNHIDIYFDSHEEALSFGAKYAEAFIIVD